MSKSHDLARAQGYSRQGRLLIHPRLLAFVNNEILPCTGISPSRFWLALDSIVHDLAPTNRALLQERDRLQHEIDTWHQTHRDQPHDPVAYKQFLQAIRYLVPEGGECTISPTCVDEEIACQAGPQLVVPLMNARFALNACNARWGSLYDALYGTDVILKNADSSTRGYDPVRGAQVIAYGREFLDQYFPLREGSFTQLAAVNVFAGHLNVQLANGEFTDLVDGAQFRGFQGPVNSPRCILLRHHGLHVELQIDPSSTIGATDSAGIKDILVESALTTIMDCEDSVAAVDVDDKILVYRNWLGLMKGDLSETVSKNGETFLRTMHADREYQSTNGETLTLPGRSLMFVRNVGHLMTSNAVIDGEGFEIPEGILDGMLTVAAALHDVLGNGRYANSRKGSVYVVKPKMHGPEEVAFTDLLFTRIEVALGLPSNTVKLGIMDEERRTSLNLKECIRAAQERVVFINTGFLDRTGDEIHTSMEAGIFAPKDELKKMPWIQAYETSNVAAGLACGFVGRAQIGKGMWARPDDMAAMMIAKIAQPQAGANTAWVPSPTAATLHALHYHQVDVRKVQHQLQHAAVRDLDTLLQIPLHPGPKLSPQAIQQELDNNAQSILGYVVRWIDQGIGCSKVADIHNVQLMEDRATLRISSQHLANWLHHGWCTRQQIVATFRAMAVVVDQQNADDPNYRPMAADFDQSLAFNAALVLVLEGRAQPNGYTEPLLHAYRLKAKAAQRALK